MNPGMVRYHSWEMLGQSTNRNGWLTADNQWDAAKIKNALDGAPAYPLVLMNIPGWPSACGDAEGRLLPARYTDFANWCTELLRIINVDQGRGIEYREITNERDDGSGGTLRATIAHRGLLPADQPWAGGENNQSNKDQAVR